MLRFLTIDRLKECIDSRLISPFSELTKGYSCLEEALYLERLKKTLPQKRWNV